MDFTVSAANFIKVGRPITISDVTMFMEDYSGDVITNFFAGKSEVSASKSPMTAKKFDVYLVDLLDPDDINTLTADNFFNGVNFLTYTTISEATNDFPTKKPMYGFDKVLKSTNVIDVAFPLDGDGHPYAGSIMVSSSGIDIRIPAEGSDDVPCRMTSIAGLKVGLATWKWSLILMEASSSGVLLPMR